MSLSKVAESLFRIYYYDAPPLQLTGIHPMTGDPVDLGQSFTARKQNELLDDLVKTEGLILRLGKSVWINKEWTLDEQTIQSILTHGKTTSTLSMRNVKPRVVQKGVDMQLGLDLAALALKQIVSKIILVSADSDLAPAVQFAQNEGLITWVDPMNGQGSIELLKCADHVFSPRASDTHAPETKGFQKPKVIRRPLVAACE